MLNKLLLVLREKNILKEEHYQAISDAIALADENGNTINALSFCIRYLELKAKGLPVDDIISMSKELDSKINLFWSDKRWQTEHNKLSEQITLKRLAENKIAYNLSAYQKLLPAPMRQYLIENNDALARHGLEMQHCVASYHERIKEGSCAIIAIPIDENLWTGCLRIIKDNFGCKTLSLDELKGKGNVEPPLAVRRSIEEMLNVEPHPLYPIKDATAQRENLKLLYNMLAGGVIHSVGFEFTAGEENIEIAEIYFCDQQEVRILQIRRNKDVEKLLAAIASNYLDGEHGRIIGTMKLKLLDSAIRIYASLEDDYAEDNRDTEKLIQEEFILNADGSIVSDD